MSTLTDAQKVFLINNEILRRKACNNLLAFTRYTKRDYQINWHHQEITKKLHTFIERRIKRLVILMPPRRGKSELCTVRLPAFIYGIKPTSDVVLTSYSDTLTTQMSMNIQRVMESDYYSHIFPGIRLPSPRDTNVKKTSDYFDIMNIDKPKGKFKKAGSFRCTGVGGGLSGMGFDYGIVDDPIKNAQDAASKTMRDKVFEWYNSVFRTRMAPNACILIVMTRWNEDDLVGRLLKIQEQDPSADKWEVLSFEEIKEDMTNRLDKRNSGEVLWPSRFSLEEAERTKASIGSYYWESLYQQRPTSFRGNIIKRSDIHIMAEFTIPEKVTFKVHSWDLTFKETADGSYVVFQEWCRGESGKYYCTHMVRKRMGFSDTLEEMLHQANARPDYNAILIEAKANGDAIIDVVRKKLSRVVAINVKASKEERVQAVSPIFEAGQVWLINSAWSDTFVSEVASFPNAANDDIVDCCSQALSYMESKKTAGYNKPITKSSLIVDNDEGATARRRTIVRHDY